MQSDSRKYDLKRCDDIENISEELADELSYRSSMSHAELKENAKRVLVFIINDIEREKFRDIMRKDLAQMLQVDKFNDEVARSLDPQSFINNKMRKHRPRWQK